MLIGSAHAHPEAHCRIRDVNLAFDEPQYGIGASDHHGLAVDVERYLEPGWAFAPGEGPDDGPVLGVSRRSG